MKLTILLFPLFAAPCAAAIRALPAAPALPPAQLSMPALEASWAGQSALFDGSRPALALAQPVLAQAPRLQAVSLAASRTAAFGRRAEEPAIRTRELAVAAPRSDRLTALIRHARFFDRDGDGVITVAETFESLRRLGFGRIKSSWMALAIHLGLNGPMKGSWTLSLKIENIHLGKHASDTGVYDEGGQFVPSAFERIFEDFDADRSGSLTWKELEAMIAANDARRPGGRAASRLEFKFLLEVAADRTLVEDGAEVPAISRERLLRFYDGSLFYELAGELPR